MKIKKTYEEEAKKLAAAIDLAIEALEKHCPAGMEKIHQNHFISCYSNWKEDCLNPKPEFKKISSLKYTIQAVFTYFQEGTGETVEYFWKRIREEKFEYVRENKLEKILNRGKIRGRIEYEYVTDMIVVAEQIGLSTKSESKRLSKMLGEYETGKKK
jgi:hypothetical protein